MFFRIRKYAQIAKFGPNSYTGGVIFMFLLNIMWPSWKPFGQKFRFGLLLKIGF